MGFIRLSDGAVSSVVTRFFTHAYAGGFNLSAKENIINRGFLSQHGQSATEVAARLTIMKGNVPTDFSTLTSYNARSNDTLVLFDATSFTSVNGISDFTPSQLNVNPAIISTVYTNATQSGLATWFWWFTTPMATGSTFNNTVQPFNQIVGTVGVTGSGADLTLPSVNIVANNPYRIFNYRLQIPTEWTF